MTCHACPGREAGATLMEVLVSILILSFGILSLSSMVAFTVQMPKLSGYRATAANLASAHVEKIRANRAGFWGGDYSTAPSYDGAFHNIPRLACDYPDCTVASLAVMDDTETKSAARAALPAGGMFTSCDTNPCTEDSMGNVWIMWQEPETRALVDPASSDNCPAAVAAAFSDPRPRCLYLRFKP